MPGERRVRWTLIALVAASLSLATAQRDVVDGPGSYPSGTLQLPRRLEASPPDSVLVPYFRVPVAGELGVIYDESSHLVRLDPDGRPSGSIAPVAGSSVVVGPGRYEVVTRTCVHAWQWLLHEDRYGHSLLTGRPLGAIVKTPQPTTCVRVSYVIEVFDDDALRETCPSWHASDVARDLDGYRDTMFDRQHVRAGLQTAHDALAICAREGWSTFWNPFCRAAEARIRWTDAGVEAYVDDCERLLDVLEQPGNWERLQGCLLDLKLPTAAEQLERQCASPEDVCARVHQNVMSLIGSASDSAQAYRNLPGCMRFLYPSPGVLEDWYTGGRPF